MHTTRELPNLRSLGVFEAAARRGSFAAAAADLGVTQAAVSKSVRLLEAELDRRLFERSGRRITLTDDGALLLDRCRSAFDYLEEGCRLLTKTDEQVVSISANTATSHYWLGPMLHEFSADEPGVSVRLVTTDRDADLTSGETDLAVLYGHDPRIEWTQVTLFEERLAPVATREWLGRHDLLRRLPLAPDEIAELPILDHVLADVAWTNFGSWLEFAGVTQTPEPHRVFSRYTLAIEAMLAGEGIALGSDPLVPSRLHGHSVVAISDVMIETGRGYHLAMRDGRRLTDECSLLFNWLIDHRDDPRPSAVD